MTKQDIEIWERLAERAEHLAVLYEAAKLTKFSIFDNRSAGAYSVIPEAK